MTTEERIRDFIVNELHFAGSAEELTPDYPILEREVVDSLGIFRIVGFLEEELGVEVADEDLVPEHFASIKAIARLVTAKRD